ncbi:MAG TPA: hypothetical protein VF520_02170 [Thermoleophilaceae bacterium]|jgi:predicted  nucleic acid-binding Zn-ribbon protein
MAEADRDDLRQFMRDLLARFDRSMGAIDRRLEAQAEAMYAMRDEMRANTARIRAHTTRIDDMRDEIKAQTRALLHVLDQLRGMQGGHGKQGGPEPAT